MSTSPISLRHFIKHLTCTLLHTPKPTSHLLLHRFSPHSSKFNHQWRPTSSMAASLSSPYSSSHSSITNHHGNGVPPYLSVLIRCRKEFADNLSEALLSFGASSVSMDEHDDYENFDEVSICSIFIECGDVNSCVSRAACSIGMETPIFELLDYNPYDWIKRTQESFDPVEVTKGLWIIPEWKTPPDAQATNIIINPGLAFGTGEHATTKMCLLLLHETVKGGESFLDYGTGSGILSIAALKLGAALSVAVDIDPQAITATRQNADLNNIGPDKLKLHQIHTTDMDSCVNEESHIDQYTVDLKYDIVIANILLNPLLDLADKIVSHAKVGAIVGLSGILHDQVAFVIECYSQFLEDISVSQMEDWACVKGVKKKIG